MIVVALPHAIIIVPNAKDSSPFLTHCNYFISADGARKGRLGHLDSRSVSEAELETRSVSEAAFGIQSVSEASFDLRGECATSFVSRWSCLCDRHDAV